MMESEFKHRKTDRRGWLRLPLTLAAIAITIVAMLVPSRASELPDVPTPSASAIDHDNEQAVAVPKPSAEAIQFHRNNNILWAFNHLWGIAVPGVLAFSGFSARLRDLARRLGKSWFFTIGIFVALYLAVVFLINLPLSYWQGFIRMHAYHLSNQTIGKWFHDAVTRLAVAMAVGFGLTWVPYGLMSRFPGRWWLIMGLLAVPFLLVTMMVMPIWIDPLYNDFGPMKDKVLERRILDMADQAGIEADRVFEVNKSVDTKLMNAYVTGILGSKRIVLWDTLLAKLDADEVLSVMGHEMGHYVLGHVPRTIWLSTFVILAGLFFVDRAGRWLIARFGHRLRFERLSDIASVPLVLLLMHTSALVLGPVSLAYSRFQEHEADRFALDLTHANHAFATSEVKMQEENLGVPRPDWFYRTFRASHPSIAERIEFANTYHPWREARSAPNETRGGRP